MSTQTKRYLKIQSKENKIRFVTRVYNGKINLSSALNDYSTANVNFGMWFQPEIPNPGVDLSKLYKIESNDDGYPFELKNLIIDPNFEGEILTKIDENFISDDLKEDRFFMNLLFEDQYKTKHYPMKFLSQITSPDILNLEYMDKDNIDAEKYILSLSEIANFVR